MTVPLVVIPTYDERDNLGPIIARVRTAVPEASVLVVDDASPDGTGEVADGIASRDDAVHVLHRPGKQGLGAAYLEAFDWALAHGHDPIVQLDADGSHLPEELPRLLARLDRADADQAAPDLVVGSRWVDGGSVENWPVHRQVISRLGSAYAHLVLRLPARDATAGFRVFRADALRAIDLADVHTRGYGFQVDVLWHAHRAGLVVVEEPVRFVERERGASKMSLGIAVEAAARVTWWAIRAPWTRRPPHLARRAGDASDREVQRVGEQPRPGGGEPAE
ncbi:dolichol-phosphate mannosyltransferase [Agromyces rhizosphaerae]|uniref:Dolichol-phosphate mannosyltransferase n=1 Tax=Agromyces rhizosphaerae TaxID=88374 RepID=A0A9W6CVB2_9MICO|nr:polyprenol monophosphomannose synthase [Agromyces rhizosphaerae]GLI27040.1 dolichol-phosphate mannosyltransferase [Agromyces rhizosphaerae]